MNLKRRINKSLVETLEMLLVSCGVVSFTLIFLAQPLKVTGESMDPTLKDGENLVADKLSIKFKPFERGEIIILNHPQQKGVLLVKRIIGLPQEKILLQKGDVYINGAPLTEIYLREKHVTSSYGTIKDGVEQTVPKDYYFLLGDNRENSTDSREWGFFHKGSIVGRSVFIYYPLGNIRLVSK